MVALYGVSRPLSGLVVPVVLLPFLLERFFGFVGVYDQLRPFVVHSPG